MFQHHISQLAQVSRLDKIVKSNDLRIGSVEGAEGEPQLALQVPTGETITLEPRAQAQLVSNWGVPPQHFERLPLALKNEELSWFSKNQPRDLTIRTVHAAGDEHLTARAVVSGRYSPFDNADVLDTLEGHLAGFEVTRAQVERDEMALVITMPGGQDVSKRKTGDIVKSSLSIRNSEIATMALGVEVSLWRLVCSNGMITADGVHVRQRHIWIDRGTFVTKLYEAINAVSQVGHQAARRLEAAHDLALPNLNPEDGKLQRSVIGILRQAALWTKEFERNATEALGSVEEATLFGLVQFVTDKFAKDASVSERVHRERVAGRLLALAA